MGSVLIIVICITSIVYFDYPWIIQQGTGDLTITSASSSTPDNGPLYNLNINLNIKFNGQMHFGSFTALNVCSFQFQLYSSVLKAQEWVCTGNPPGSYTFSGSDNFSLMFNLNPINSSLIVKDIQLPINITFHVYSNIFNVTKSKLCIAN